MTDNLNNGAAEPHQQDGVAGAAPSEGDKRTAGDSCLNHATVRGTLDPVRRRCTDVTWQQLSA
jgi:hypothetical protein